MDVGIPSGQPPLATIQEFAIDKLLEEIQTLIFNAVANREVQQEQVLSDRGLRGVNDPIRITPQEAITLKPLDTQKDEILAVFKDPVIDFGKRQIQGPVVGEIIEVKVPDQQRTRDVLAGIDIETPPMWRRDP